jgi:LuxR family transcriptional regulator, maltose regulon positive regulatory protein
MSIVEISANRTKIVIPALRPDVLHRRRLLALFDDLLEKKLIIITAPAGYGKTSLLVDFSRQSEMPVCWLSLDNLDKDMQRFMTYLIAALAERFPNFGKRSNAVLRTITSFEQDSERLLSSLVNEINDQINEHFTLVVDDYHFVDFIPSIRDLFSRFISLAGENCHVILASRRLPTLPDITLMVARQQVSGFDLEELAFRPDEIRALFEKNYGVKLTRNTTEEMVRQTEGWITGIHLSAPDLTRGLAPSSISASQAKQMRLVRATGVDLAVYLDQQVLSKQTTELRQFLLQTSLLEEFDLGLCEAVLGPGNWKNFFKMVLGNNLFVLSVGPDGKWLRYHNLFKEFLQGRIFQESPEAANRILARLEVVCEERGEWEKAYALTQRLGNLDALAGLIERVGTSVLLSERLITLQTWLDGLPETVLERRPVLLSLKGALLGALGDGRAALPLLDRAVELLQNAKNLTDLPLALVRRASASRIVGDYSGAIQDIDQVFQLAKTTSGLEVEISEATRFKGICLFRLGQVEEAVAHLEDALRQYEFLGEQESIARLQMDLGWVYQSTGKYSAAAQIYQKAQLFWKRKNNLYSQASALNNLAVLHYMQGNYESAVKTLEEGLVCARQGSFLWQEVMQLASLGDILSDLDEYESAYRTYATAMNLAKQVSYQFLINYLLLVQARLARLRGRLYEAHTFLQEARPLIQTTGSNYERGLLFLESGCLSLAETHLEPVLSELKNALDQFQHGNLTAETEWTRVWLAAAFAASGDEAAARKHLETVLNVLGEDGQDLPLIHMLRHASPWLADLHSDPKIAALLKRVARAEERLPVLRKRLRRLLKAAPLQGSRLTIQALGKLQVRVNGRLVSLSQWQTHSVRDLFFFFLSSQHPVTKDEIGAAFWPDIDPALLKLRFKNNLYRLRHALGQDVILFENNHYFFNHTLDYEYDVEEFDAHLVQAKVVELDEDKIVHLQAASNLWRGPYLQDLDANWAWADRQRLERAYLEALHQLAELHRQTGDRESALQTCRRALEVNSCAEDFHRLAMRIHADLGDRLAVIWQYQACRDILHTELDVLPSEETQALYRRLIS